MFELTVCFCKKIASALQKTHFVIKKQTIFEDKMNKILKKFC